MSLADRKTVVEGVRRQVARTPDFPALDFSGACVTYDEVGRASDHLAKQLRDRGVTRGARVAIALSRSAQFPIAVLAVLKTGAACVPIDVSYPTARITTMLEDSVADLVITSQEITAQLPAHEPLFVSDDDLSDRPPLEPMSFVVGLSDPAYVVYTSGSTGVPKGVTVTHGALGNLVDWQCRRSALGPGARTLQLASLSFDVMFQEIFATWCVGGTLVVIPDEVRRGMFALLATIRENDIQRLFVPFVTLHSLANAAASERDPAPLPPLEIVSSGEQLRITPAIRELMRRSRSSLDNQYGPAETHVVTAHQLDGDAMVWPELPPIGRAIDGVAIHVLDSELRPAHDMGEIYIGGIAVGAGYHGRPADTAAAFIPDQFGLPGSRLYRTGDLAQIRHDGTLAFIGRMDDQVKIRGFRVELAEIEAVISRMPDVAEVCASIQKDHRGEPHLVAYLVPSAQRDVTQRVALYLEDQLPDYMLPSRYEIVRTLPRTLSGKMDRRSLPAPEWRAPQQRSGTLETETERTLALIWRDVLSFEEVSADTDFFSVGGHSLAAMEIVTRVYEEFEATLSVMAVFEASTLRELASVIDQTLTEPESLGPVMAEPPLSELSRGSE